MEVPQQIPHALVVDLDHAHHQSVAGFGGDREQIGQGVAKDPGFLLGTIHGVGFARSRLPVREDRQMEALRDALEQRTHLLVDLGVVHASRMRGIVIMTGPLWTRYCVVICTISPSRT